MSLSKAVSKLKLRHIGAASLILVVLISFFGSVCLVFGQVDQAEAKLQAVDNAVSQAFGAVLDAQKAGSNVTGLLAQLSSAGDLLAQAEVSYRTGDPNSALSKADQALVIAQEINAAANAAERAALASDQNEFWFIVSFTIVGNVVFVFALFFVWRWFKSRYTNRICGMKPEVASE